MKDMQRKGFTLIEVMIVVAITAIVATIATLNLFGNRTQRDLTSATQEIGTLLRQAQSDSLSEKQGASWGVHFDNTDPSHPFYSLFSTTNATYASSSEVGHYTLPSDMCYVTSTVSSGGTLDIIFNQVSGAPITGVSSSVSLQLSGCGTASTTGGSPTITPGGSGQIFFDDFNRANL
jgi:prepilin-type N-terminal cleavage/methylation domain-containing protein